MIEVHRLMCLVHWRAVPPELSLALHRAARHGRGVGTEPWQKAFARCVAAVNER
jgi:hypothetical protein